MGIDRDTQSSVHWLFFSFFIQSYTNRGKAKLSGWSRYISGMYFGFNVCLLHSKPTLFVTRLLKVTYRQAATNRSTWPLPVLTCCSTYLKWKSKQRRSGASRCSWPSQRWFHTPDRRWADLLPCSPPEEPRDGKWQPWQAVSHQFCLFNYAWQAGQKCASDAPGRGPSHPVCGLALITTLAAASLAKLLIRSAFQSFRLHHPSDRHWLVRTAELQLGLIPG